jgi:hypothetical protein
MRSTVRLDIVRANKSWNGFGVTVVRNLGLAAVSAVRTALPIRSGMAVCANPLRLFEIGLQVIGQNVRYLDRLAYCVGLLQMFVIPEIGQGEPYKEKPCRWIAYYGIENSVPRSL